MPSKLEHLCYTIPSTNDAKQEDAAMLRTRIYRLLFWAARAAALPSRTAGLPHGVAPSGPSPAPAPHPATTRAALTQSPPDDDDPR